MSQIFGQGYIVFVKPEKAMHSLKMLVHAKLYQRKVSGASPNFLRMAMYLELSRPKGDVGRWEKVLKRLILLNKHYPLKVKDCNSVEFQRKLDSYHITELLSYNVSVNCVSASRLLYVFWKSRKSFSEQ